MKKVFVFTGPTLSAEEARRELDARVLPPVAQGDLYRAALERPRAIGIIDGYFQRVPAVWHKEILWAMAQGIHVFGAASMGALRAAELAAFGMEGVGRIFEAFHRGELEDDDEVAVMHAPAEDGYRVLSEAMVNIRATLRRAEAEGVLSAATGRELERTAKSLFYAERSYPRMLAVAVEQGLAAHELEAFRGWLPRGQVNAKREDALAMLRAMRAHLDADPASKQVSFFFEDTDAWEALRRDAAMLPGGLDGEDAIPREALLEELRLESRYPEVARAGLARALALEEARRQGLRPDEDSLRRTEAELRRELGLADPARFANWQREAGVEDLPALLRDETEVRGVGRMFEPDLERCIPDHLRVTGEYTALLARARDKQRVLSAQGLEEPGLEDARVTRDELWHWYFETRLGQPRPEDLETHARSAGFEDARALERAALRELLYVRSRESASQPGSASGHSTRQV